MHSRQQLACVAPLPHLLANNFSANLVLHSFLAEHQADAFIFRDLQWIDRAPRLLVELIRDARPSGELHKLALKPGDFLGINTLAQDITAAGLSVDRYCAGYAKAQATQAGFFTVSCPDSARISRGKQCPRCLALDEFSAMHGVHRGARLTPAAQAYADLDHWLYIATFPDGTSKVGTASARSKPRRLDEQAVATATYIGHAKDGAQVRIWEDLVSQEAQLVQAKQVGAKYKAWTQPRSVADIYSAHQKAVALAHWSLQEAALFEDYIDQEQIMSEPWKPSAAMTLAYDSLKDGAERLHAFSRLVDATHGFYVTGATGKFLTAHCGNEQVNFLVNLAEITHRAVLVTGQVSEQPLSQTALF